MKKTIALFLTLIIVFMSFVYADEEVTPPAEEAAPTTEEAAVQAEEIAPAAEEAAAEVGENVEKVEENIEGENTQAPAIDLKKLGAYSAILSVIFLIALIYMTGLGSIRVLLANCVSGLIVWIFFTKALIWGWNKTYIIISTTILLIISNLLILKGLNKKSLITFIGCFFSAMLVVLTSFLFILLAKYFEIGKEALSLNNFWVFDFNYIYLSIVITLISSLGICLEVGHNISIFLFENKNNNENMKLLYLIKEAKKQAKTIINSKMNILLFNTLCIMNIIFIFIKITSIISLNEYEIYVQISTLFVCETLGILYTILCTTFSFWLLYSKRTEYKKKSSNIVEGKRSLKI